MPAEKGKLGPRPSNRDLLKNGAEGTGGDGAGSCPGLPPPSRASRVSFSRVSFSPRLQVQQSQSPSPSLRGDRSSRHSRLQQSSGSRPGSARPARAQGSRSGAPSPVPLPPPANTAARGQCRRLRSCVACSGKVTPETPLTVPSTPPTPASIETEPLSVHRDTQTEPPERSGAAPGVDREAQTESPAQQRRSSRVRLFMDRETQTKPRVLPPGTAPAAPGGPEPPGRRQRLSRLRRLLRACRRSCCRAQPPQLGASPRRPQAQAPGFGVLMVLQEASEGSDWLPNSWPWLVETSM